MLYRTQKKSRWFQTLQIALVAKLWRQKEAALRQATLLGTRVKSNVQLNVTQTMVQLLALLGYKCFKGSFKEELLGGMMAFIALMLRKHCKSQLENSSAVLYNPHIS